jgi:hypothetical protein
MSGYGPHQERRIAITSSSKVEILSNLSSIQDLVSRIQMIYNSNSNSNNSHSNSPISVKDWHIDAQYANAVIISFKTEQEAVSILSISTSDKCISLRYDTEAAGSSSSSATNSTTAIHDDPQHQHPPQHPPPPGFSFDYTSFEHQHQHQHRPVTLLSTTGNQDAWFESEEIVKPKSFADAVQIAERKALQLNNFISSSSFPTAPPTEEVNGHGEDNDCNDCGGRNNTALGSGPFSNTSSSSFQRLYPKHTTT